MDLGKVTDAGRLVYHLFHVACRGSGNSVSQASFSSLMSRKISLPDTLWLGLIGLLAWSASPFLSVGTHTDSWCSLRFNYNIFTGAKHDMNR